MLCQGEPGIGEARLAQEVVALAAAQDVLGAWGLAADSLSAPPFESEEAARGIADNASMPPEASVTFGSVDVYEVVRATLDSDGQSDWS